MISFSSSFLNTWNIFIIVLWILSFQSVICVLFGGLFPLLIFSFIMGCIFLFLHILGSFWLHAKTCEFYLVWCFFLFFYLFFSFLSFYSLNTFCLCLRSWLSYWKQFDLCKLLYSVRNDQNSIILGLLCLMKGNILLGTLPNVPCIARFLYSGCWECELFSILCKLPELLYLLLSGSYFPCLRFTDMPTLTSKLKTWGNTCKFLNAICSSLLLVVCPLNYSHLYISTFLTYGSYCSLMGTVANHPSFPRTEGLPRTLSVLKLGKSQVPYSGFPFLVHCICLISIRDHHSAFPVFQCLKTTVSYIFFLFVVVFTGRG